MRHQYAVLRRSPLWAWDLLDAMIRDSPESYLTRAVFFPDAAYDRSMTPDGSGRQ